MGEIADDYIDQQISGRKGRAYSKVPPVAMKWTTASGKQWYIDDMESGHILNCIHSIEKNHGHMGKTALYAAATYRYMVHTLINRGYLTWGYLDLSIPDRIGVRI